MKKYNHKNTESQHFLEKIKKESPLCKTMLIRETSEVRKMKFTISYGLLFGVYIFIRIFIQKTVLSSNRLWNNSLLFCRCRCNSFLLVNCYMPSMNYNHVFKLQYWNEQIFQEEQKGPPLCGS